MRRVGTGFVGWLLNLCDVRPMSTGFHGKDQVEQFEIDGAVQ
jgi:hypothetical protein